MNACVNGILRDFFIRTTVPSDMSRGLFPVSRYFVARSPSRLSSPLPDEALSASALDSRLVLLLSEAVPVVVAVDRRQ